MRFWPVKFRTVVVLGLLGLGGWQAHGYLTAPQDQLVAIDTKSGQILWNRPLPEDRQDYPPIVLSSDRLLVTDFLKVDGKTICFWSELSQQSGDVLWRKSLKEMGLDGCPLSETLGVAQEGQFYTFWEGQLWQDPEAGSESWRLQQAIVAMDFNNHKVRWISPLQSQKLPMKSQLRLGMYSSQNDVLVVRSNQIFAGMALSWQTGQLREDGKQAGADKDQEIKTMLTAFKPETGSLIWQEKLDGAIPSGYLGGYRSVASIDYNNSFIFYLAENYEATWRGSLRSYDMRTGKLEATAQKPYTNTLFQHKGNIYYSERIDQKANNFTALPGNRILDRPILKILVQHPSCPTYSEFPVYPSKNHLLSLCRLDKVAYNDPLSYTLFAVDERTGNQQWQLHIPHDEDYSSWRSRQSNIVMNDAGERLFLPTAFRDSKSKKITRQIQAIATEDGKQEWRLPIYPLIKPVLSGDRLFVITRLPRWQTLPMTRPRPVKP
jgi:outer membrane protein assembly factor BamB